MKIQAAKDAEASAEKAIKRKKLLDALASHDDKALASMSRDEIEKRLAEL